MSKIKVTMKLVGKDDSQREFDISHAENILALEKANGLNEWELDDKNYQLKDGKIIPRKNN